MAWEAEPFLRWWRMQNTAFLVQGNFLIWMFLNKNVEDSCEALIQNILQRWNWNCFKVEEEYSRLFRKGSLSNNSIVALITSPFSAVPRVSLIRVFFTRHALKAAAGPSSFSSGVFQTGSRKQKINPFAQRPEMEIKLLSSFFLTTSQQ